MTTEPLQRFLPLLLLLGASAPGNAETLYFDPNGASEKGYWKGTGRETGWDDVQVNWAVERRDTGPGNVWWKNGSDAVFIRDQGAQPVRIGADLEVGNLTEESDRAVSFAGVPPGIPHTLTFVGNPTVLKKGKGPMTFSKNLRLVGDFQLGSGVTLDTSEPVEAKITVPQGASLTLRSETATAPFTRIDLQGGRLTLNSAGVGQEKTHVIGELAGTGNASRVSAHNISGTTTLRIEQSSDTVFAGKIEPLPGHLLHLEKAGAGRLQLEGLVKLRSEQGQDGTLTVEEGTLALTGDAEIDHGTVAAGGTLTGSGTLTTSRRSGETHGVRVAPGGTLAPGNPKGLLIVKESLLLEEGATFEWRLFQNSNQERGEAFTGIDVGDPGKLEVAAGTMAFVKCDGPDSEVDFTSSFWESAQRWIILRCDGETRLDPAAFSEMKVSPDSKGNDFSKAGGTFTWVQVGSNILLDYTPSS